MIFTSWTFGAFLAAVLAVHWMLPSAGRPWWLIIAGMAFYAAWYPPQLLLILGLTILVERLARAAAAAPPPVRRTVTAAGISGALAVLAYYKYSGFTLDGLTAAGIDVAGLRGLVPAHVPLAISFFVFEYVHYLIEIRRGRLAPGRPRDVVLFILFFPTLVCGPIKRFADFAAQIGGPPAAPHTEIAAGFERMAYGFAKKILVADTIGRVVDMVFTAPHLWPTTWLWVATYGYALQILFDFSGYSDIAIGTARLFGFHVPENFAYPYFQPNLVRFWRCWHMSLTSWITDYVYVPLGGNRRGPARTVVNRLLAMGLCGLWHGAAGHFVLWGLLHGIGLNLVQGWQRLRPRLGLPDFGVAGRAVATVATFHFVCAGWLLFRLDTVTAWRVFTRLLGF